DCRSRLPDAAPDRSRLSRTHADGVVDARPPHGCQRLRSPVAATALALITFDSTGSAIGYRMVDPEAPTLPVTEFASTRGDGIFEGIGIASGRPLKVARHLVRFAESARRL